MTVLRPRTSSTSRSRRTVATMSAATLSIAAAASFGIAPLLSPASATPRNAHSVVVCHWVPAHGGSYVRIVIDESGLNGHDGHANDLVGGLDDTGFECVTPVVDGSGSDDSNHENSDDSNHDSSDDSNHENSDDSNHENSDDSNHENSDDSNHENSGDPSPEATPTEEPTPEVTPTEEPTPEVTPTEEPTPEVTPTEEPTPEVTPTEEPTPEVTPTEEPTPEVTPTEEPTVAPHRVIVCHYVPAHVGTMTRIEIDVDGLAGHTGHVHDIVGPVDDLTFSCDPEVDPTPVTPTEPTDTEPTEPTDPSSPFVPEDVSDNASGTVTVDDLASSSAVPTELAHTGTQASSIALIGAGLLAAGTFVLVAGRKRREV